MRTKASLAALETGGQDICQGELVLDLIDSLHVSYNLQSPKVRQQLSNCELLLVRSVSDLDRKA